MKDLYPANAWIDQGHVYAVPKHLRDAHYKGAKDLGFGKDYIYPHSNPEDASQQSYLPEECSFFD